MASTSKCPYCDSTLRSDEAQCPNCGAPNALFVTDTPRTVFLPRTIGELQEYCAERGMPLLRMRFFIGENITEPKAFGIYRDGRNVVVYKNKADGTRSVRYRGPDEARAVNEIFQKLLEECRRRGIDPDGKRRRDQGPNLRQYESTNPSYRAMPGNTAGNTRSTPRKPAGTGVLGGILDSICHLFSDSLSAVPAIIVTIVLLVILARGCTHLQDGYYRAPGDDRIYYNYGSSWYYSYLDDDDNNWYESDSPPEGHYSDYAIGEDWSADWGVGDIRESDDWSWIESDSSGGSSGSSGSGSFWWDSDSDSDWDSWDSGDTDWDSDW